MLKEFLNQLDLKIPRSNFTIKKSGYLLEKRGEVAHVAGRLRIIIISHHLTGVSSSLSRVTLETSLVLLAGGQGFFLEDHLFCPT